MLKVNYFVPIKYRTMRKSISIKVSIAMSIQKTARVFPTGGSKK